MVATVNNQPAVLSISSDLLNTFGSVIKSDFAKRSIGYYAGQILLNQGYEVDRPGLNIKEINNLFSNASLLKSI